MRSWLPGADEFSPAKCAASIRAGLRPSADAEDRRVIRSLWEYHRDYLHATTHGDGNQPSPLPDGTVVYYSWQASTGARFFMQVYGMALGLHDEDEWERRNARDAWKAEGDFDALWDSVVADEKGYRPVV